MMHPPFDLTVYYDGLCPLCSREIAHYRKKDSANQIQFIDITDPKFSAEAVGLDPRRVNQVFHVRTANGTLLTGVDAFAEIWRILPGFSPLYWLSQQAAGRGLMNLGYRVFVKIRPLLPRKEACDTGVCHPS